MGSRYGPVDPLVASQVQLGLINTIKHSLLYIIPDLTLGWPGLMQRKIFPCSISHQSKLYIISDIFKGISIFNVINP